MPKIVRLGEVLNLKVWVKQCYQTNIGGKCPNWKFQMGTFWVILKHCVILCSKSHRNFLWREILDYRVLRSLLIFLFWPSDVSTDFSHNPSYGAFFRRRWKCQQDLPSLHFPIGSARWGTKKRSFELPWTFGHQELLQEGSVDSHD